jgi:hypothetical protein
MKGAGVHLLTANPTTGSHHVDQSFSITP